MDAPVRSRSRDGTRIAYSVAGEGPVLVHLQVPSLSHIELYPRQPGGREYLERLGEGRTLIRIDFRGTGMSDREYEDHSPDGLTDDLEAVLDELQIETCDVSAGGARVTPALGFAARRPAAVARMVLGNPYNVRPTPGGKMEDPPLLGLMESDWDHYLEITSQRSSGRRVSDQADIVAFVHRCMDQHNFVATLKASRPGDDWDRAAAIDIPVLVADFIGNAHIPANRVRAFADRFPRGRYMAVPESALPPPYGDPELYLQALHEFLGPAPEPAAAEPNLLTAREREVLGLLAAGRTQPEIADALVISPSTVSRHVVSLYTKIGVHRRAEAVTWAIRHGLG